MFWKYFLPAVDRFPYRRYRGGLCPIVPIEIKAKGRWRKILVYVDSGAAYSVLTVAAARRLGLMRIKARKLVVTTSGGRTQKISLHRLWVRLAGQRLSVTFGVPRGFDVDFNLLGRHDLFKRFAITFDDKNALLTLTPHRK
ncbi:MAG: aspartyl protease family protein [Candidatus Omnitrophica bacterium]|nr:aspartyl protease family protein [Candidatus Omnitrophota bacterium]